MLERIGIRSIAGTDYIFSAEADSLREVVRLAVEGQVDLSFADLKGADLSLLNLSGAKLNSADLSDANLSGAKLDRAHLTVAVLDRTNL
ncbi:MAG: pentapeptide repeat-containing protein, partial [Desulfomonilaceae bacterium]